MAASILCSEMKLAWIIKYDRLNDVRLELL